MNCWLNFAVFLEKKLQAENFSIHIGKILLEQQSWSEAARALNNGITKGKLEDSNEAYVLLKKCHRMMSNSENLAWNLDGDGNRHYE